MNRDPMFSVRSAGFSLVEVLITMLIMGLSVNGLLSMLHWGSRRYSEIADSWKERQVVSRLGKTLRGLIVTGMPLPSTPEKVRELLPGESQWRISGLETRECPPGAVMVKAVLFRDKNGNGVREVVEEKASHLWCFRGRADQ